MTKVDSRDADHWCVTEDVRGKLQVPSKGTERDYEEAIQGATNSVQAWFQQETGETSLPDAGTLDDLLVESTAWLAVSEASFTYSRNFGSDGGDTGRTRTAKDMARAKFSEWADQRDVGSSSEAAAEGQARDADAKSGALIDEF